MSTEFLLLLLPLLLLILFFLHLILLLLRLTLLLLQRVVNMEEGKGESQFGEWPHMCAVLGPEGGYR